MFYELKQTNKQQKSLCLKATKQQTYNKKHNWTVSQLRMALTLSKVIHLTSIFPPLHATTEGKTELLLLLLVLLVLVLLKIRMFKQNSKVCHFICYF